MQLQNNSIPHGKSVQIKSSIYDVHTYDDDKFPTVIISHRALSIGVSRSGLKLADSLNFR